MLYPIISQIFNDIYIDQSSIMDAVPGDKVVCRMAEWRSKHLNPEGEIIKIIGNSRIFRRRLKR